MDSLELRSLPLRDLLLRGQQPRDSGRIFYHNIWFPQHSNSRYEELLPRLKRVECYLITLSSIRWLRGVQFRALRQTRRFWKPSLHRFASHKYRWMLSTDIEQVPLFRGRTVVDIDDPTFSPREVETLNAPHVAAVVVTGRRAAQRFQELGVLRPCHVIPQGVNLLDVSSKRVEEIRRRYRRPAQTVLGYMASHFLTRGDRGGENPKYNVDHLFELWNRISGSLPFASLWLIGTPSSRVRARYGGNPRVRFFGHVRRAEALALVASLDIALYPRSQDQGVRAVKIAEYMCMGVPTVSYDYLVTRDLDERGAGILVRTPNEFVNAVCGLAKDGGLRRRLAAAARSARRELDWEILATRYQTEILDRYLR
jgi:glycosyltransferase involved in cell wall biosynthesis